MKEHKRMLIIAGGTGGHIIPAIAMSRELNGFEFTFICGKRKIEKQVYDAHGITPYTVDMGSFSIFRMISSSFAIFIKTFQFIRKNNFSCVVSAGSYVSLIPSAAALCLNKPLFLLEQDIQLGVTNKLLSFGAKAVFTGFQIKSIGVKNEKLIKTGHIVKRDILTDSHKCSDIQVPKDKKVILVMGGSQGSLNMTRMVIDSASKMKDIFIIAIAGMSSENFKNGPNILIMPYTIDMGYLYSISDLVVSRAGALSYAELLCAGKRALFIPLPTARNDHQTTNAAYYRRTHKQFDMLEEKDFTQNIFEKKVNDLLNHSPLKECHFEGIKTIKKEINKYV